MPVNLANNRLLAPFTPNYSRRYIHEHVLRPSLTIAMLFLVVSLYGQPGEFTFGIYSSQEHQLVPISDIGQWETQRYTIRRGLEAVMGPLPDRTSLPPLDIQITDTLETSRYFRFTIRFQANEGERVPAYLYLPKRSGIMGKLPAMVALHPTGLSGKKIVDGEGLPNRGYAKELAERGYVVIAPDYPGYGDLEKFDFSNSRYQSGTMAAIFYHMRCVDVLCQMEEVDRDKIGVIGHSLGGHNAMFVGAFDPRLKVIVVSCGWTQMEDYDIGTAAIEQYGGRLGPWAQDRYMPRIRDVYQLDDNKIPFNFHEIIALLAPRAFFSNSPLNDSNFAVEGVRKGMGEAEKVYQFLDASNHLQVRYPEAEHDFPDDTRLEAYQFIDRHLDHHPSEHRLE
jgi:pimeloyl-ACP methyl ester carboxylesterase